jgi:hypothetical protein
MAAVAATSVSAVKGRRQFGGLFHDLFTVTATLNPDDLADAATVLDTIAVAGVALGDVVLGISQSVDRAGLNVTAYVSAANEMILCVNNESGGAVNLASYTLKILVGRPNW